MPGAYSVLNDVQTICQQINVHASVTCTAVINEYSKERLVRDNFNTHLTFRSNNLPKQSTLFFYDLRPAASTLYRLYGRNYNPPWDRWQRCRYHKMQATPHRAIIHGDVNRRSHKVPTKVAATTQQIGQCVANHVTLSTSTANVGMHHINLVSKPNCKTISTKFRVLIEIYLNQSNHTVMICNIQPPVMTILVWPPQRQICLTLTARRCINASWKPIKTLSPRS